MNIVLFVYVTHYSGFMQAYEHRITRHGFDLYDVKGGSSYFRIQDDVVSWDAAHVFGVQSCLLWEDVSMISE